MVCGVSVLRAGWPFACRSVAVSRSVRFTLDGEPCELTPEVVRAHLAGRAPEGIRDYWVEIDGKRWPPKQVISLSTGVSNRGRFQSQSARRWLQNLGFAVGGSRHGGVSSPRSVAGDLVRSVPASSLPNQTADVLLIGCVKGRLDRAAPAKELYDSSYFRKMRAYAERSGAPWFILSAEHGLVRPDQWLEPYDCYLADMSGDFRRAWGEKVVSQLHDALGHLAGLSVEVHAGGTYVDTIGPALRSRGVRLLDPLRGLSIGRRLSWYAEHQPIGVGNS